MVATQGFATLKYTCAHFRVEQADGMFLGEFCCLIAFVIMTRLQSRREASQEEDEESLIERPRRTWSPVIFLLPALCDMTGTSCQYVRNRVYNLFLCGRHCDCSYVLQTTKTCTFLDTPADRVLALSLLNSKKLKPVFFPSSSSSSSSSSLRPVPRYIGLTMTTASVFQMLRGAVVIFTGFFSVIFLKRKLHAYQYVSMILVLVGTLIVGLSSVLFPADSSNASNPLVGGIIIFVSQVTRKQSD